jgi:hypothetical protein
MNTWRSSMAAAALAAVLLPGIADAQERPGRAGYVLRPEWKLDDTRAGQPRVVGYVYNDNNTRDATNVWLRVERVAADGAVQSASMARVQGDIRAGGRLIFDVPVPEAAASYRVLVDSVDWVLECR